LKKLKFYGVIFCFGCYLFFCQLIGYAQENPGDSVDCTDVSVNYLDDPTLTREERLRLMDKAFFDSLNKFELCQAAIKTAGSANAEDGAAGGLGDSAGEAGGESTGESVASSTMSGTDTPRVDSSAENIKTGESAEGQTSQSTEETGTANNGMTRSNGKLPEDIPSANNDDTLAAQIRYAAENETDPVKREKLWNEYRKYKGLPVKQ